MAEACFSPLTKHCDAHLHSTQFLPTCSFPARLKTSFVGNPPSARLFFRSAHKSSHNVNSAPPAGFSKKKKRKVEEDPWESLFRQLEKDLENDKDDGNEEDITEEDVANLEKELDTLLQDIENATTDDKQANESNDMLRGQGPDDDDSILVDEEKGINAKGNSKHDQDKGLNGTGKDRDDDEEEADFELADDADEDSSDDEFEEPRIVNLQKWQLRKLAAAVELGRRKVNIKSLAAELKLDRHDLIYFLKNPPPELLMAVSALEENADEDNESVPDQADVGADIEKTDVSVTVSVNDDQDMNKPTETQKPTYGPRDWYKGKRIKKTNLLTLERVYQRSRRPTNSMIESLVQATHLPRSRILEWFEEQRARSGARSPPRPNAASRQAWKKPVTHSFERLH
ncbi:hypothetical protein GOP47_0024721 [Adiantum capillus-veneris]|uniref:Homeobox domain-containing protein n=1 Tax=Adiantum capillus-veneris TaxID=13818 RepID=A0A9D4U4Y6_ADICA|nr:hypothetical protein GOP47_0024721 [Adiantum capillus-veneris]